MGRKSESREEKLRRIDDWKRQHPPPGVTMASLDPPPEVFHPPVRPSFGETQPVGGLGTRSHSVVGGTVSETAQGGGSKRSSVDFSQTQPLLPLKFKRLLEWDLGREGSMAVALGRRLRPPEQRYSRSPCLASLAVGSHPSPLKLDGTSRPGSQASRASARQSFAEGIGGSSLGPAASQRSRSSQQGPSLLAASSQPRPDLEVLMRKHGKIQPGSRRHRVEPPDFPPLHPRSSISRRDSSSLGSWVRQRPGFTSHLEGEPGDHNRPITPKLLQRMRARLDSRGCSVAPRHHAKMLDAVFYPPTAAALQSFAATL